MESGDLKFWGIVAVSIISVIIKAVNKKSEKTDEAMPDFKGSKVGDMVKKFLDEVQEKEDDYIPRNPRPATQPSVKPASQKVQVNLVRAEPMKRPDLAFNYNQNRSATENMPRRKTFESLEVSEPETVHSIESDPVLKTLNLSNSDELKRAIIYNEILRPKF